MSPIHLAKARSRMMLTVLLSATLTVLALAGCSAPSPPADESEASSPHPLVQAVPATNPEDLWGVVVDPAIHPIPGATLRLAGQERTTKSDETGAFRFDGVGDGAHQVQAFATGYALTNVTVTPENRANLRIVMQPAPMAAVYSTTHSFEGRIQCAFEALLISPSCDSAVPLQDRPFDQNHTFLYGIDLGWQTQVIDVVFDGDAHPGLDGLRIALRGIRDDVVGGDYTQYGRWHSPTSFTATVEPSGSYPDGVSPIPPDYTGFRIDVYPHGHGYHQACVPDACFLGAGVAVDVSFNVYVTTFYGQPAPEGFTLREAP